MPKIQENQQSILATVSLLSASTGMLDVSALASNVSPDWIIPSNLILDVIPVNEHLVVYPWKNLDLPVYSLVGDDAPAKLVVVESKSDLYRIGLLVDSSPIEHQVRISELKDADDEVDNPYCLQAVMLENELNMVPDLDKLSHKLIDLD